MFTKTGINIGREKSAVLLMPVIFFVLFNWLGCEQ